MYWYVLFVQTGREHKVEIFLKEWFDAEILVPFVPLQEILFKKAGTVKKQLKPLFPGYVFIESELTSQEFLKKTSTLIYTSHFIVSLLKYSDTEISMRDAERQILLGLCNNSHCIESSSGIINGDRIQIIDGPLKGYESIIKRVNRHKRQALIEIELIGDRRQISVPLEVVQKII